MEEEINSIETRIVTESDSNYSNQGFKRPEWIKILKSIVAKNNGTILGECLIKQGAV